MSLNQEDLRYFQKHYPGVDLSDAYWEFICYSTSSCANVTPQSLEEGIWYGISFRSGGGLAEMSMLWDTEPSPYLHTFMDAVVLLNSPTHRKISLALIKYKDSGPTQVEFSKLLLSLGFENNTTQLPKQEEPTHEG